MTQVDLEKLYTEAPALVYPTPGSVVEGKILSVGMSKILVDLNNGKLIGSITGKESKDRAQTIRKAEVGDDIKAFVLKEENEYGYVVLSLNKISKLNTWQKFVDAYESGDIVEVKASEANKGGLLLDVDGIKGFIPVSQLSPVHYPRVDGGDSNKILSKLNALKGVDFKVKVINVDHDSHKLILSEKAAYYNERSAALSKLKVGTKVKGKVSSIVKFGIFVTFDGLEGLVHISEIAWGHVGDPRDFARVGHDIEVLIIGLDNDKISLSIKQLKEDPWLEMAKKFQIGTEVEGTINRISPFGAFLKLDNDINGLIHLSELSEKEVTNIEEIVKIGDSVKATVINIDSKEHRIGLSLKPQTGKTAKKKDSAKKNETKEEASNDADLEGLNLSDKIMGSLKGAGINNVNDLKGKTVDDLTALEGIGAKTAEKILAQ